MVAWGEVFDAVEIGGGGEGEEVDGAEDLGGEGEEEDGRCDGFGEGWHGFGRGWGIQVCRVIWLWGWVEMWVVGIVVV